MGGAPAGTVTFLLTDVEGSTALWEERPRAMATALALHDRAVASAVGRHGGHLLKTRGEGDSAFAVFERASHAVACAADLQRDLRATPWPEGTALRVRVAVHTGAAEEREGDYYGPVVNRAARLRAAAHGGQVVLSHAARELVAEWLPDGTSLRDLGQHRFKDLTRPERVYQLCIPGVPGEFPPLRSLDEHSHNLPVQLTRFIGRGEELARVQKLLEDSRLVTLTGSGGSGKTRLALQAAADVADRFPDGVWLVEFGGVADPALVPATVATVLGVSEAPGRPLLTALAAEVHGRELLLVFDGCEHLLGACASMAESLLSTSSGLRVLATTREPLRVTGEAVLPVQGMHVPGRSESDGTLDVPSDAVQLFVDRALLVRPDFRLTPSSAPVVADLCRRLEGIPLAIELAAARLAVLTVEQIAARLVDRFRLLTGGSRTARPRHQTLRAAIDWSYDLLTDDERRAFRRLSVFAGGFTLEAADHVYGGDVLELVSSLVAKSLVRADEGRYRMLETIREYASEKLAAAGERRAARAALLQWLVSAGGSEEFDVALAERERDNIGSALEWAVGEGVDVEGGFTLAASLLTFWDNRGYWSEGRRWLEAARDATGISAVVRGRSLHGAARLAWLQGDLDDADALGAVAAELLRQAGDEAALMRSLGDLGNFAHARGDLVAAQQRYEESLSLARAVGNERRAAGALNTLGTVAHARGDLAGARSLYEESLRLCRDLSYAHGVTAALGNLGTVARASGDLDGARAYQEESLAVARQTGDRREIAVCLDGLGILFSAEGDHERARVLYEEALALQRELGDAVGVAGSLSLLGESARRLGDEATARRQLEEAEAAWREVGHHRGATVARLGLALLDRERDPAAAEGQCLELLAFFEEAEDHAAVTEVLEALAAVLSTAEPERAARLAGASDTLRHRLGRVRSPSTEAEFGETVGSLRARLGDAAFETGYGEGRAMSEVDALAYARRQSLR